MRKTTSTTAMAMRYALSIPARYWPYVICSGELDGGAAMLVAAALASKFPTSDPRRRLLPVVLLARVTGSAF
eukprot:SAG31_NODE_35688_length_320_cov_1.882353_2_plen_71_part_01